MVECPPSAEKGNEKGNVAGSNDQKPETYWSDYETSSKMSCASWMRRKFSLPIIKVKTIWYGKGAAEALQLFEIHGRDKNLLSSSKLPVNLLKVGHDGHTNTDAAFSGEEPTAQEVE
ncbi:hypothetical protein [endosymbiont of Riftia pachyptila]|uniref:hypothetical protein n=1 Tax=endosymbiont of Riftia pachyptila TaxID=54396 RepID=UPI001111BDBC|nr:hypothetical protein [endosymbiont of Riftia pachyptila]